MTVLLNVIVNHKNINLHSNDLKQVIKEAIRQLRWAISMDKCDSGNKEISKLIIAVTATVSYDILGRNCT